MRLYSGAPYWLVKDGLQEQPPRPLPSDTRFDVAVIGAGITGALVADALTTEGLSVAVLDRRVPAAGSTAVSSALLTYEIDVELADLIGRIGEADAVRAYRLCADAVAGLERIATSLPDPCGFARRSSLYLASRPQHAGRLQREVEVRQRHGFDAEFWSKEQVRQRYDFRSHGAIRTNSTAVLDPVRFTRGLLGRAAAGGAKVFARTRAVGVDAMAAGVRIRTDRGDLVAQQVVYAMGYETPEPLRPDIVTLHSTYVMATEPVRNLGPWDDQCLVWETARPYMYMRATEDCRIILGGADAPFTDVTRRDSLMPARTRALEKRLKAMLPSVESETAFAWAGTFAETPDGLPLIGPSDGCPCALFALAYGGNGITFGLVAANILRDLCVGKANDDARIFRLHR